MDPDRTVERQQALALLDKLSPYKLNVVRSLLEVMVEPLSRSLAERALRMQRSCASSISTSE